MQRMYTFILRFKYRIININFNPNALNFQPVAKVLPLLLIQRCAGSLSLSLALLNSTIHIWWCHNESNSSVKVAWKIILCKIIVKSAADWKSKLGFIVLAVHNGVSWWNVRLCTIFHFVLAECMLETVRGVCHNFWCLVIALLRFS